MVRFEELVNGSMLALLVGVGPTRPSADCADVSETTNMVANFGKPSL